MKVPIHPGAALLHLHTTSGLGNLHRVQQKQSSEARLWDTHVRGTWSPEEVQGEGGSKQESLPQQDWETIAGQCHSMLTVWSQCGQMTTQRQATETIPGAAGQLSWLERKL